MGRAGRQTAGKCYRIFTESTFTSLKMFMLPVCSPTPLTTQEILRINLIMVVLQLKAIGFRNIAKFDFLDKPKKAHL